MFGDNLLPLLVLALGGAMLVGNVMALARPPAQRRPGDLATAPKARTIAMAVIGGLATTWALASLIAF